jgi:hypothetical protein
MWITQLPSSIMVVMAFRGPLAVRSTSLPSSSSSYPYPSSSSSDPSSYPLFAVKDETQTTQKDSNRQLHLFNSLTLQKDPFQTITPQKVSMYTCGPTVYDYAHVGNFRAFLTYDVLKRTLQYFGYQVDHVCNLTDVDDKIIKKVSEC